MIDILPLELCGPNGFGASKEHLFILNTTKDSVLIHKKLSLFGNELPFAFGHKTNPLKPKSIILLNRI
tara:strand:- start:98 stop:301 length:204 start_codon:yes stop_codon:yes gene_type:complete